MLASSLMPVVKPVGIPSHVELRPAEAGAGNRFNFTETHTCKIAHHSPDDIIPVVRTTTVSKRIYCSKHGP